jgi:uncharacterized integral membrane protein
VTDQTPPPPPSTPGFLRRHAAGLGVSGAIAIVLLLFIVLNDEKVEVDLVVAMAELRLAWALLIAAGLGFAVGYIVPRLRRG